jgi:enterochelin esterase-like enzyme
VRNRFSIPSLKPVNLLRGLTSERYAVDSIPSESPRLGRQVKIDVFRPHKIMLHHEYPLLILNDGQDAEALQLKSILEKLWTRGEMEPPIVVGIHAGDRMHEYGVAGENDFAGRGSKAAIYSSFILDELLPYLHSHYPIQRNHYSIAGFSLGALSALDIAWNHAALFKKVGTFSGSFWWRKVDSADKSFDEKQHRIMHNQIREAEIKTGLKFWFQTGTKDEPHDRNGNGVIDSIDDTLDLIAELTKKGYRPFHDIVYHEIKGGEHNQHTWAQAMPHFLKWAFPPGQLGK